MWIYTDHGEKKTFEAVGNGPIDAVQRGMQESLGVRHQSTGLRRACAAERFQHRRLPIFICWILKQAE